VQRRARFRPGAEHVRQADTDEFRSVRESAILSAFSARMPRDVTGEQLQEQGQVYRFRRFFRTWMQDPLTVGAMVPSSRALARLMAKDLVPGMRVVELGAGTGRVTEAILESGVRPEQLFLIEQNAEFVRILRRRFPRTTVINGDAQSMRLCLGSTFDQVDCVVSSLPLLLFSNAQKSCILSEAFTLLGAGGCFRQFTYAGRCPIGRSLRSELALKVSLSGVAALNFPPAFVYRLERRPLS
jgi:phosphatidylethanolamine/phosphatidyl-N-methylethanolamine N-methyltransferase